MIVKQSYHMSEEVFTSIYRAHCHIKFNIRRSMVLSFLLLLFGLAMEYVFHKDYGMLNGIVLVLFLISLLCNYVCDYRIPKTAYRSMYDDADEQSTLMIQEDGVSFGEGGNRYFRSWDQFEKCYETKDAFLLYQKDVFTMVWKEACGSKLEEVRNLIRTNVNRGKPIPMKK